MGSPWDQYFGNTGYNAGYQGSAGYQGAPNYHGTPGYQGATGYQGAASHHEAAGFPSFGITSSFSGLDAGLSVLALLAFGVWLLNLLLPQLRGAVGLGLRGLFSRGLNPPQDAPRLLAGIHSSGRQLVHDVLGRDSTRYLQKGTQTKAVQRIRQTTAFTTPQGG